MKPAISKPLTKAQWAMASRHGTPSEFKHSCMKAVPDFISMDEASAAIDRYEKQWREAGEIKPQTQNESESKSPIP